MRRDMAHLLRDTHGYEDRWGPEPKRARKHRNQPDERPNKEGNGKRRGRVCGIKYSVLQRWLRSQVGRPWDDVHSDARATLDDEMFEQVLYHVERREVRMIDGWPHRIPLYYRNRRELEKGRWADLRRGELYVDGQGFLRMAPMEGMSPSERRCRQRWQGPEIIMLDKLTAAAKVDGTWFKADLEPVQTYEERVPGYRTSHSYVVKREMSFRDVLWDRLREFGPESFMKGPTPSFWERKRMYGDGTLYASRLRTMSKKEIKQRIPEDKR